MSDRMKYGREIQQGLIRKRFDDETVAKLLKVEWWNWEDELIEKYAEEFRSPENFINKLEDNVK